MKIRVPASYAFPTILRSAREISPQYWVAVRELKLSYLNKGSMLSTRILEHEHAVPR